MYLENLPGNLYFYIFYVVIDERDMQMYQLIATTLGTRNITLSFYHYNIEVDYPWSLHIELIHTISTHTQLFTQ